MEEHIKRYQSAYEGGAADARQPLIENNNPPQENLAISLGESNENQPFYRYNAYQQYYENSHQNSEGNFFSILFGSKTNITLSIITLFIYLVIIYLIITYK